MVTMNTDARAKLADLLSIPPDQLSTLSAQATAFTFVLSA